ncbi:hypothetical protein EIP86_011339 [Pleurotus ostreatoroseus]|nr:hypothetical protein EIP86_011339 [Pleurotus ostreatoroseus]
MSTAAIPSPSCATAEVAYFYKLIEHTAPPPDPLPDALPVSALDQSSGFVHLSTAAQVPGTLRHFFTDVPHVFVARIPRAPLDQAGVVRWEDPEGKVCGPRPGEGLFPHLYNGLKLGKDELDSVRKWDRNETGWDDAVRKVQVEGWLVD